GHDDRDADRLRAARHVRLELRRLAPRRGPPAERARRPRGALVAVASAPVLDRLALLGRATRPAHRDPLLDHVARICVAILLVLDAAARIALAVQGVHVAPLLRRPCGVAPSLPPSEHVTDLPGSRLD